MSVRKLLKIAFDFLFGTNNIGILYALITLVILDYITGICVAVKQGKLSSSIGAKGIARKVVIFSLVALSNILDNYFLNTIGVLEAATILFYCANESISIMENACNMGIPIPKKLKDSLKMFGKDENGS